MPITFPDDLTQQQIDEFFPLKRAPIKAQSFEIGLVLGGTVSAGAYTAGVLDYLIEACDAWTRAKELGDVEMPTHEVIISTIAAASGGAVYGSVFARAAGFSFEHGMKESNPFFQMAQGVDLFDLLSSAPENGAAGVTSLLNCSIRDRQSLLSRDYQGGRLGDAGTPRCRSYLADPLRLIITVGNLRGIPYTIRLFGGEQTRASFNRTRRFYAFRIARRWRAP